MFLAMIDDLGIVQAMAEVPDGTVIVDASQPYYVTPGGWKPITVKDPEAVTVGDSYRDGAFVGPPDPNGFKTAALKSLGAAAFNPAIVGFTAYTIDALNQGNWELVRTLVAQASTAGALTKDQHAEMLALLTEYRIP